MILRGIHGQECQASRFLEKLNYKGTVSIGAEYDVIKSRIALAS